MGTEMEWPMTDFEMALRGLEGLAQDEITELVISQLSAGEAASFAVLKKGLSLETLRVLSATTIARQRRIRVNRATLTRTSRITLKRKAEI